MFTQEFCLPDVLRLWDSVFSEVYGEPCLSHTRTFLSKLMNSDVTSGVLDFLVQFSCAMLLCVKERIIAGDFSDNMELLQNYPVDLDAVYRQLILMRQAPKRRSIDTTQLFEKIRRSTIKYKWSNPFEIPVELFQEKEETLKREKSVESISNTQLQDVKKSSFILGSQDEVIELN
jgi:hypothetical protein